MGGSVCAKRLMEKELKINLVVNKFEICIYFFILHIFHGILEDPHVSRF